jgi:hypothetical protein
LEPQFWRDHPQLARQAADIATLAFERLKEIDPLRRETTEEALFEGFSKFKPFAAGK